MKRVTKVPGSNQCSFTMFSPDSHILKTVNLSKPYALFTYPLKPQFLSVFSALLKTQLMASNSSMPLPIFPAVMAFWFISLLTVKGSL